MPSQNPPSQPSPIISDVQATLLPKMKDAHTISKMAQRIKKWTGTATELAQIICSEISQNPSRIDEAQPEASIDRLVKESILDYWEGSLAAQHLGAIANSLLQPENKDLRLLSYLRILQQGSVANTHSPEHKALLSCRLVLAERANLKVANPIYAHIFDIPWIEKQIPGITRPVAIKKYSGSEHPTQSNELSVDSKQPSTASGLYSKLAVCACCVAVVGGVISAYRYEPGDESFATQATRQTMASLQANADPIPSEEPLQPTGQATAANTVILATPASEQNTPAATAETATVQPTTDRTRFDQGVDHATNGRWLPMVREFCQLSPNSTYTTLAKRQLESWVRLYKEDIEIAKATFTQEEGGECSRVSEALASDEPLTANESNR